MSQPSQRFGAIAALALLLACLPTAGRADVFTNVPTSETNGYSLIYTLNIPNTASYNNSAVNYSVNNSATYNQPFDRIAYYLELQAPGGSLQYAYASMDAFTTSLAKVGVPTLSSGGSFQRNVSNLNVYSNASGVVTGTKMSGGNIEFWPYDYTQANGANVPNASGSTYDFGDTPTGNNNYGSMQIHNHSLPGNTTQGQTIIAYNQWGGDQPTTASDLGIGNQSTGNPDWTFANNAAGYTVKNLEVLVHAGTPPPPPPPPPPPSPSILPLGDSITRGSGNPQIPGGYRTKLYTDLINAGRNAGFLGSATDNPSPTLTSAGQINHEGHDGYRIDQIAANLDGSDGSGGNNGGYWLSGGGGTGRSAIYPNFITLHIGTNDILQGRASTPTDLASTELRLRNLVDQITSDRPSTNLMLSNLIPINSSLNTTVREYNAYIQNVLVPAEDALGKHVYFVDQYDNFVDSNGNIIASMLPDNIHPSQAGYDLMGDTWFNAIQAVPEPTTLGLLGVGAVVLMTRRRAA